MDIKNKLLDYISSNSNGKENDIELFLSLIVDAL